MTIFGLSKRQKAARGLCFVLAMLIGHSSFARNFPEIVQTDMMQQTFNNGPLGVRPGSWQPVITFTPQVGNINSSQQNLLWPGSVSYGRTGENWMKYYLQPNLQLGVSFTYNFTFQLHARDYSAHPQNIPDGWYLMQMAVVLPQNSTSIFYKAMGIAGEPEPYDRFVTSRSMFVQVSGGLVSRKVTLDIPSLSATTVINHLLVEFTPLQVDCDGPGENRSHQCLNIMANGEPNPRNSEVRPLPGYRPYIVDVNFVPFIHSSQTQTGPEDAPSIPSDDKNLTAYILKARLFQAAKFRERPPTPSPGQFAQRQKLSYLTVNDPMFEGVGKYWLKGETAADVLRRIIDLKGIGTLDFPQELGRALPAVCYALAMKNQEFRDSVDGPGRPSSLSTNLGSYMKTCATKPGLFMRMARVTHVYQFDTKNAKPGFTEPLHFSVQTNFMVSRSSSEDVSRSYPNPITAFFKLSDSFGIPFTALGFGYSVSKNNDRSKSDSTSGAISSTMDFNMVGMHIPILK